MDAQVSGRIVSFIWRIADDVLRDVFVRGKYRDVILPMTVIRRLDAVLEPTKQTVLDQQRWTQEQGIRDPAPILRAAAEHPFYNTSTFTLRKQIQTAIATRDETAAPIVKKRAGAEIEYEPDPDQRDIEQIPLTEPGGIAGFIERELLPYAPDAWVVPGSAKTGYEISFTRYFYQPKQLRPLAAIEADIRALEAQTDGLLDEILVETVLEGGRR